MEDGPNNDCGNDSVSEDYDEDDYHVCDDYVSLYDRDRDEVPSFGLDSFDYEMCLDVGLNPETIIRERKEEARAKLLGEHLELINALSRRKPDSIVMELINEVNVNSAKDEEGNSCLHLAVEMQNLSLVEHMLKLKANIECKDKQQRTALILAAEKGGKEVVKKLVEAGANVNAYDVNSYSVLHHATKNEKLDFDVIQLLIEKGARADTHCYPGTPVRWAIFHRDIDFSERMILAVKKKFGSVDDDAIFAAVQSGKDYLVKLLLDLGLPAKPTPPSEEGLLYTALEHNFKYTSYDSWMRVLKLLLEHGADAVEPHSDFPPIKAAVACGDVSSIKLLMEHGVNLKNGRRYSIPLLAVAAGNPNVEVLQFLLRNKVHDVNETDIYICHSALISTILSSWGTIDHVKELLKAGAYVNDTNESGDSALLCVVKADWPCAYTANLLLFYGAKIDMEIVEKAVDHPADDGDSARHIICHIVLRRSRGLQFDKEILRYIRKSQFKKFYRKCRDEISILRRHIISGSITLYDILTHKDLMEFAINEDFMRAIKSLDVKEKCPSFADLIEARLEDIKSM
ncbi:hypothetical protein QAD02_023938 [Eretmocerus hayati]|uniref:Uncharacterized protein n=1 Tax=Eretmocerus hayati TaxID=131215 RepID=A0ACC2PYD4_9HYME|nr:hypothetical protein QAD02_023938 [Eretmocerus hayati]